MDTKDRMKNGIIETARALGKEVAGTAGSTRLLAEWMASS